MRNQSTDVLSKIKYVCFTFSGRISRGSYFKYWLLIKIVAILDVFVAKGILMDPEISNAIAAIGGIIVLISGICVCVGQFSIAARRAHDLSRSGLIVFGLVVPVLSLVVELYLLLAKGAQGTNAYGPVPLD